MNVYLRIFIAVVVVLVVATLSSVFNIPLLLSAVIGASEGFFLTLWVMAAPVDR